MRAAKLVAMAAFVVLVSAFLMQSCARVALSLLGASPELRCGDVAKTIDQYERCVELVTQ